MMPSIAEAGISGKQQDGRALRDKTAQPPAKLRSIPVGTKAGQDI